ncbi:MAG: Ig-like domain-containing protein [Bryobacteraceae bacterium]
MRRFRRGRAYSAAIGSALHEAAPRLEVIALTGLGLAELKDRVAALPQQTVVLVYVYLYDPAGHPMFVGDLVSTLSPVSNSPIMELTDLSMGAGALGGHLLQPSKVGGATARLALRILAGEKASDIPVQPANAGSYIFDWRQLQRWKIPVSSLPPSSEVRYRPFSIWEHYWWAIMLAALGAVLESILVAVLLWQRRQARETEAGRKRAELETAAARDEISHLNRVASMGELAASLAHELNQPLAGILSNAQAAQRFLAQREPDLGERCARLSKTSARTMCAPARSSAVTVSVSGGATSATFNLTNTAGAASKVAVASGGTQSAAVNTAFANALAVTVTDANNNPVSGATVTFTAVPVNGASATFSVPAITDSNGHTSVTATANATAGAYTVTASVSGGTTSATFNLTNTAGAASKVTVASGGTQSTVVTTAFANALAVTVTDANNNPVSGATVTFTAVPVNGASATFSIAAVTDSNGHTSVTATANATAGAYTVTASVSGGTASATFNLTNTAGAASKVTVSSGNNQSAPLNTAFATNLQVTVTDANNNPVSGVMVTFTAPSSGASGLFANNTITTQAPTNASGVATATVFTANAQVGGPYNVTATVSGLPTVSFALTNIVNVSNQVSVTETGFARNRTTGVWTSTMTVTNIGTTFIAGPVQVVLTNLTATVAMTGNTGIYNGIPYITVATASIAPGKSATVSIQFTNPNSLSITFTPVTYSGAL